MDASRAYRCCIVHTSNVTEGTIEQIAKLREFNDGKCPKPILILVDIQNEENEQNLKSKLYELAYKTGNPGKLFCLIIFIKRILITHGDLEESDIPDLKHQLSRKEQEWFETKYKEMENTKDIDVETLLAFNLMRKSFDKDYMRQTTTNLMKVIPQKELEVLKCIALVSSYDMEAAVPLSIFDEFMEDSPSDWKTPWGIAHPMQELQRLQIANISPWNNRISQAMSLLITQKVSHEFYSNGSGVCILSQILAEAVLQYILQRQCLTLENVVDSVLDLVKKHFGENDYHSRRFVKTICCLFKTRQWLEGDRMEYKQSFSELVMKLKVVAENETEQDATDRVTRVMQKCFEITDDGYVGQQLARFYIYVKDFEHAETIIRQSLEIFQQQNSYLWHTYGQIYKTKFESLLDTKKQKKRSIPDKAAVEIIGLAFQAIQKFREGQLVAIELGENTTWGFFQAEVKTALFLLEHFDRFACYTDQKALLSFLNDDIVQVAEGPLLKLSKNCEMVNYLRVGSENQRHIEESLRSLEERNYQVKRQMYVIYSDNETLLLGLRERFERMYGKSHSRSKYQFNFGIGLKPLMLAKERKEPMLQRRVDEARDNLEKGNPSSADERDLLVYLGYELIMISGRAFQNSRQDKTRVEYRRLLSYSNNLVSLQREEASRKRLFLETFLYYAMLHWPLQSRTDLNLDVLAKPTVYEQVVQEWEEAYNRNFYIKTIEQNKSYRPKNYFALAKGSPGNDIIDLESVKREWMDRKKQTTGRVRKPVLKDYFWREDFVEEKLERLEGLVHDSGHAVMHTAKYPDDTYTFKINTYYPCSHLSNRAVTFVLGFTWKGPTAFDVVEKGNCCKEETASTVSGETETQMCHDPTVGPTGRPESDENPDGAAGVDLTQTKRKRRRKKGKKTKK